MTELHLYKPRDVDVKVQFPQSWEECSRGDLLLIARFTLLREFDITTLFVHLLKEALHRHNIKGMRCAYIIQMLSIDDLAYSYMPLTEFMYHPIGMISQPVHIPGLVSPEDGFSGITCGEYEDAEALFIEVQQNLKAYHEEGKGHFIADNLHTLCRWFAILYRPGKEGKAEAYNPQANANYNPGEENLLLAMLWYMSSNSQLPQLFKMVFVQGAAGEPDAMAVTKLIHHGAGPKNGTRDQIRRMPLYEFLYDLQLEAEKTAIG